MKVMLNGTDALWRLWLGFFREHFAAILSVVVLLPLSLYLNWRLAILLFVLCIVFTALTTFVVRRTFGMQMEVEEHYSELSARASDALGNVALVQSFVRVESEVKGLRSVADQLLAAQMPVLSWWALVTVITRASTTITVLAIFTLGISLHDQGLTSVGEIVMFVSFATLLIQKLEQVVSFINNVFMEAPRLREFFNVLDAVPAVHDRPDAIDAGRLSGLVEFNDVTFSYDGKRPAIEDLSFTALPGQTIALVGATGAGKSTAIALLHRAFDPQSGFIRIDGMDVRGVTLTSLRRNIGVVFQEALLFNRSIAENLRVGKPDATEAEMRTAAGRRTGARIHRAQRRLRDQCRRARPHAVRRRAPAAVDRPRIAERSAAPDPGRGDQRARRRHRGQGECRSRRSDEGAHHLRDRPPSLHHPQCHADPGVRERACDRKRNFR
ncbi:ABC-type multidrug transport system fused ATPase/permease subunit [Bradyrhizobium sp. LM6.11]